MRVDLTREEINMLTKITAYFATEIRKSDISGIENSKISEIGYSYMSVVDLWSKFVCIDTSEPRKYGERGFDPLYKFDNLI